MNKITDEQLNIFEDRIKNIISEYERVCVACSGGADSTLLLFLADKYAKPLAVLAMADMVKQKDTEELKNFVKGLKNTEFRTVTVDPFRVKAFRENTPARCYFCKKEIFNKIIEEAQDCDVIFDGSNTDDLKDYRPGMKALEELKVVSPFLKAGINKEAIYALSRKYNLPTMDKPASACLASRIPTGEEINKEKLKRVEEAEEILESLGFKGFRLRLINGKTGIFEGSPEDLKRFSELYPKIKNKLRNLSIDLEKTPRPYRQGSMNKYEYEQNGTESKT